MRLPTPLLLHVEFLFELENAKHVIANIIQPLKRKMWKCSHGKRSIAFVIITEESSAELVKRLKLGEMDAVTDFSCFIAPIGAVCKYGSFNSLNTALDEAWKEVGKRRHPEYVRQTKRFDPRVEWRVKDSERGAVREVRVEPTSMRQTPKDLDRK
jgi:hypothetical protein